MIEQITKQAAEFGAAVDANESCARCSMYSDGMCSLVLGIIDPGGTCKFFEPDRSWE